MTTRDTQLDQLRKRLDALKSAISKAEVRELSDADFAARYLPFSSTTLSRIYNSEQPYMGNLNNMLDRLSVAEEDIYERIASARIAADSERAFVPTTVARATQSSVKRARDSKDRRIVVLLAPTGAGKSTIGKTLAARGAVYIEGRQSWRKSYKAFCADLARAAGRPLKTRDYNEHGAEERMLEALRSRDNTLYIDEANTLSRECVNALKLIVNATGTVIVIAAIPAMWDKLSAYAEDEVAQLVNRCQPILRYRGMTADDARPFLEGCGLSDDDLGKCLPMIVEAANEFGAYKAVVSWADDLRDDEKPTAAGVERMLKFTRRNVKESGIKTGALK